jgi:hypothetical protein
MKNNFLFIKSQTSKVVFSFLILIILTAYIYSNSNQGPKYAIYDRSCELIGMYEIEEYNQILRENDSYLGYCIEDVYLSTTTLKDWENNPFKDIFLNVNGCYIEPENISNEKVAREEIYIVGHAYGTPGGSEEFFPKELSDYLINNSNKEFSSIALTGDFVRNNNLNSLETVYNFIKQNFSTYFLAIGNHEVIDDQKVSLENYNKIFDKDIFIKDYSNVLVIAANYSNSNWLPNSYQINKINDAIKSTEAEYIILLTHQIFWQKETDGKLEPNSYALLTSELSYDSLGWLEDRDKNFIIISGDYGAFGQETFCIQKYNRIFIANGIGGLPTDTLLKFEIYENQFSIEEVLISTG